MDPTPDLVQDALAAAANAPGYPATAGTARVEVAARSWLRRRCDVTLAEDDHVIPSIGSKEMVALLPTLLGLGPEHTVVIPTLAYPTYDLGARIAGCQVRVTDRPEDLSGAALVWHNSPGNPSGHIAGAAEQAEFLAAAREAGAVVASDECYAEFGWDAAVVSMLHDSVSGGDHRGIMSLHSLSKRSNMAGYRYGFAAGDGEVIIRVLQVRKHLGLMVPIPIQAAAVVAFDDDAHVEAQREIYLRRRSVLAPALTDAGFRIDHSQGGLYLWATRGENCWDTARALAEHGVLVTPGDFYGDAGVEHVRVALTATDDVIGRTKARLASFSGR